MPLTQVFAFRRRYARHDLAELLTVAVCAVGRVSTASSTSS